MQIIEDIEKIKKIELDILIFVKDFCESNNIRYYLCGGTLLGAVRHKGFIPWDDDIDIYMPRPDYDRFLDIFNSEANEWYKVLSPKNQGYYYNFAKVVDTRTKLIEREVNPINEMGVYIDIFPLEGMPEEKDKQMNRFKRLNKLRERVFDYEYGFPRLRKNIPMYIYRVCTYFVCKFRSLDKCQSDYTLEAMKYSYNNARYVFVTGGRYKTKDIFPFEYIGDGIDILFENTLFKAPKEYEKILRQLYGEYLQLPPEKDQVKRHGFLAYSKE